MKSPPPLDLFDEVETNIRGMGPHYLTLYSLVLGFRAPSLFEFGSGHSTAVMLRALHTLGAGGLWTVSPAVFQTLAEIPKAHQPRWWWHQGRSEDLYQRMEKLGPFDLALHDGSHDTKTVEADLLAILPRMKRYGLVLVHDSQHSYSGAGVRLAIQRATVPRYGVYSQTTLPFGFGLTIIRVESSAMPSVQPRADKVSSIHHTALAPVGYGYSEAAVESAIIAAGRRVQ